MGTQFSYHNKDGSASFPRLSTLNEARKFVVGDMVVTDFYEGEEYLLRTITDINPDSRCGSGISISATSGNSTGSTISNIDAQWFRLALSKIEREHYNKVSTGRIARRIPRGLRALILEQKNKINEG